MSKTIEDVMICPNCGSDDCYQWDTDEIDFATGNEHYYVYCKCNSCNKNFKLCMNFKYEITRYWAR